MSSKTKSKVISSASNPALQSATQASPEADVNINFKPSTQVDMDKRRLVVFSVALLIIVFVLNFIFFPSTLEDAFITFRYSQHFAEGYGFGAWNTTGERVEGYTTFLWMVLLAAFHAIGFSIETVSKLIGMLSHLALCALFSFFPLLKRKDLALDDSVIDQPTLTFGLAAAFIGIYLPIAWYAVTGMESLPFLLLIGLCLLMPFMTRKAWLIAIPNVLLILIRPEGILFSIVFGALHFLLFYRNDKAMSRVALITMAIAVATLGALSVHRLVVFGDMLPNTYYAKEGGERFSHINSGKIYLQEWLNANFMLFVSIVAAIVFTIRSIREKGWKANLVLFTLWGLSLFYFAYAFYVGGDNPAAFPYWRHIVHIWPLVAMLASIGLINMLPKRPLVGLASGAVILLAINWMIIVKQPQPLTREFASMLARPTFFGNKPVNRYFLWLKDITSPQTTIATSMAGEMPFVVDANFIDILGLNDSHIAHNGTFEPKGAIDSKTDMPYVMGRHPDIIEGYISGTGIIQGKQRSNLYNTRFVMINGILDSPIFQQEYVFIRNAPYNMLDKALFMRKAYWENLPNKSDLDVVPVMETSLYTGK